MTKKNHNSQHESTTETADRGDRLELVGVIEECKPGTLFIVRCDNGHQVIATLSGKLRLNRIRLIVGDNVRVEVSPYDLSRGRIVWRT
jgi:translation initiation factor IF-1